MPYFRDMHVYLRAAWVMLAVVVLIDVLWIALTDITFKQDTLAWFVLLAAVAALVSTRMLKPGSLKTLLDGYVFITAAWPALRLFNHLTFTQSGPYVDAALSRADQWLGLSWFGYASWVDSHPLVSWLVNNAYSALTPVSIVAFVIAALAARRGVAEEFLLLFTVLAIAVSLFAVVFPALGTMVYYPEDVARLENLRGYGAFHVPYFEYLRHDPAPRMWLEDLPGLATFPSFHTAMGLLVVYAARDRWLLLVPATIYSGLMIMGTPVFGSHYFVDLIAGSAITVAAIVALRAWRPQRGDAAVSATIAQS